MISNSPLITEDTCRRALKMRDHGTTRDVIANTVGIPWDVLSSAIQSYTACVAQADEIDPPRRIRIEGRPPNGMAACITHRDQLQLLAEARRFRRVVLSYHALGARPSKIADWLDCSTDRITHIIDTRGITL